MSSPRLVAFMNEKLLQPGEANRIDIQKWILTRRVPQCAASTIGGPCGRRCAVATWKNGGATSALQTAKWSTQEWLHFLRALPETVPSARLAELDRAFAFSQSGNSEILFAWLKITIQNRFQPAFPALEKFLLSQGRLKFIAPLYADLEKTDWGRKMAIDIYRRARPTYHFVSTNTIDQTLKWREGQ